MGNLRSGVPCFSRREGGGVPCSFPTRKKLETPHRRLKYEYNGKRPRKTLWGDLIFGNFLPGIMVIKLNFLFSGILVWMVRFADFVFLPDFLENVHRKFPYHLSPFLNFRNLRLDEKLSKYLKFLILKCARSKNRMEIIGTPRESDNISVFWEK